MTSDEALSNNRIISFERARAELRRHGMDCNQVSDEMIVVYNPLDTDDAKRIPCTSKAILEWLGY